jgi:hypothetical protein
MAKDPSLEELRQILDPNKVFLSLALIKKLELAQDNSTWRAELEVLPDQEEVIARMTWDQVGPKTGIFGPASVGDLVLVAFADADEEQAFVIRRLSSKADLIPEQARESHNFFKSLPGKKTYIGSETKTIIGALREGADPTENLVLGQELKTLLITILAELKKQADTLAIHTHTGNAGVQTSPPTQSADFTANGVVFENNKTSPVEDEIILSDIVFTEKS